jgi:hypothetical protein
MTPCTDAGRSLRAAACGCLAIVICCLAAPRAAATHEAADPDHVSASERISLPYGGQVRRETAELTARMLARLAVLHQVETVVAELTAVRFGLDDARRLTALADMALPPVVSTLPLPAEHAASEQDESGTSLVTAQAEVSAPLSSLPGVVQAVLARPDELELQAEALSRAAQLAAEARELIRRAAIRQRQGPTYDSFVSRLTHLDPQLRAMERYMLLLDRFGAGWTPPTEAESDLRDLQRLYPDNSLINLGLAEALLRLDRPHEAVRFAGEALRLEPGLARALYVRGMAQLQLRLSALATADFSQALVLRPDKAAWWRARGAAHMIRRDYESMCADLHQACMLGDCAGLAEVRGQDLCIGRP